MPPRKPTAPERPASYHAPDEWFKARLLAFCRAAARKCNDQGYGAGEFSLEALITEYRDWVTTDKDIDPVRFRLYLEDMRDTVKHLGSDCYLIL